MRIARIVLLVLLAGCAPERGVMPRLVETVFVSHLTVPCMGVGPMTCLQVRRDPNAEWTLFYGGIEGFSPEPGYAYAIEVEIIRRSSPIPADASDRRYRLRRIIWRALPEVAADRIG